jgi:hypothetical protein
MKVDPAIVAKILELRRISEIDRMLGEKMDRLNGKPDTPPDDKASS